VSTEQALNLARLGFDWSVDRVNENDIEANYFTNTPLNVSNSFSFNGSENGDVEVSSTCTVVLALKWMRDVKGFTYYIFPFPIPEHNKFDFEINITGIYEYRSKIRYKSQDDAENALLNKMIEVLTNDSINRKIYYKSETHNGSIMMTGQHIVLLANDTTKKCCELTVGDVILGSDGVSYPITNIQFL
jgi:hypothetical protein